MPLPEHVYFRTLLNIGRGQAHAPTNYQNIKMKKILYLFVINFLYSNIIKSQEPVSSLSDTIGLGEVVISANKTPEDARKIAQQIKVLKADQIQFLNTQSTADLLISSGTVAVQKSQQGGGSPIIRGLESNRVLLVVDGVRMNNLIFRGGHLQNVVTTDPTILDRIEVLYGSASTAYGSDALGGVIHLRTKAAELDKKSHNVYLRYGSVNNELSAHADVNLGNKKFASLTSFTYSDYGDLRSGTQTQALDTLWGLRKFYAERINGKDSLVSNSDPAVQKFSGFKQYDFLQKFNYKQNSLVSHGLNLQFSTSTDVPRYDRLTDPQGAGLRFAEWYYGPQERLLAAYQVNVLSPDSYFEKMSVSLNYQKVQESRHDRRFGNDFRNSRIEDVNVAGFDIDFLHRTSKNTTKIGIDAQLDEVVSTAFRTNVKTDTIGTQSTRYPDGSNRMNAVGAYFTNTCNPSDHWSYNSGVRLGYTSLRARFNNRTFFPLPYSEIKQENFTYSANFGAVYSPNTTTKIASSVATGFRVPNIDDVAKVFESVAGRIVVPNNQLKPERTYTMDLTANKTFGSFSWENTVFGTLLRDALVVAPFQFNGQDSITYSGSRSLVLAAQNQQKAYIYGYSTELKGKFGNGFTAGASFNYTVGKVQTDTIDTPLDHIPPIFGRLFVQYAKDKYSVEASAQYNGWKQIKDFLKSAEDNEQYALASGMPAWYIMNLRGSYQATNFLTIQAGVENIMDIQYRHFASGINAAGRNIYGTLRFKL